jgi:hypothetical protein
MKVNEIIDKSPRDVQHFAAVTRLVSEFDPVEV